MAIFTPEEAAGLLDYGSPDEMPAKVMSILVPAVEQFLKDATGKDWSGSGETYQDFASIDPTAKMAAGMLLIRWFENPGQIGATTSYNAGTDVGFVSLVAQLQAKAQQERQAGSV